MTRFVRGDIFAADCEAVVNAVNTVGVMGKGLALQFKLAYLDNFLAYHAACKAGQVQVGRMFVFDRPGFLNPKYVVNFPTKRHWSRPSEIMWIVDGLQDLKRFVAERQVASVAIPALGCGSGGLDWRLVLPVIEEGMSGLDGVDVAIYLP